jgi:hypothetical protein
LKKACDWELLHKRTDYIQEQSGKTLNAMSTYQVKILEIEDHIQNQEIVDVEEKVVRRVGRGIKTTQTRPVTVVANVEGVEKIFT